MYPIVDFLVDLMAGILLLIMGWFSRKCWIYFRLLRPLSKVLGTLADNTKRLVIVVPKLYSYSESVKLKQPGVTTETIQWPQDSPLFAQGDARAMMYIYNLLLESGKKIGSLKIKSDVELTGEDREGELVCIGAGSNSMTKDLLTIIEPQINFEHRMVRRAGAAIQLFGTAIVDRRTNQRWTISGGYDYGLIARLKNPNDPSADILILAGLGPSGTAASGYFISTHWREIYDALKTKEGIEKSYEALIQTNIADPTDSTLIQTAIV